MNLRPATVADAPAIARLHLETLPAGVSDLSPLGERLVRHFYARAIERGVADVRVAEENGELLGFVVVTPDIGTMFPRALLAGPVFEVVGQFEKGGQRHYHMVCKKSPPPPL
jgi:hypothetical protein